MMICQDSCIFFPSWIVGTFWDGTKKKKGACVILCSYNWVVRDDISTSKSISASHLFTSFAASTDSNRLLLCLFWILYFAHNAVSTKEKSSIKLSQTHLSAHLPVRSVVEGCFVHPTSPRHWNISTDMSNDGIISHGCSREIWAEKWVVQ